MAHEASPGSSGWPAETAGQDGEGDTGQDQGQPGKLPGRRPLLPDRVDVAEAAHGLEVDQQAGQGGR